MPTASRGGGSSNTGRYGPRAPFVPSPDRIDKKSDPTANNPRAGGPSGGSPSGGSSDVDKILQAQQKYLDQLAAKQEGAKEDLFALLEEGIGYETSPYAIEQQQNLAGLAGLTSGAGMDIEALLGSEGANLAMSGEDIRALMEEQGLTYTAQGQEIGDLLYGAGADISGRAGDYEAALAGGATRLEDLGLSAEEVYRGVGEGLIGKGQQLEDVYYQGAQQSEDIFKNLSRSEMPGQSIMESRLKSQAAGAVSDIRGMGGGAAGLSALANINRGSQEQMQDLAMRSSQYQVQSQQNYAGALQQGAGMRAQGILGNANLAGQGADRMGQGISLAANLAGQSAQMRGQGIEGATGLIGQGAQMQAQGIGTEAQMGLQGANTIAGGINIGAQMGAQGAQLSSQGIMTNTGMQAQATGFQNQGLDVLNQERMNEFQYNQLTPYQTQSNFYQNEYATNSPTGHQMQLFGDQAGLAYADKQQAQMMQSQKQQNRANMGGVLLGAAGSIFGGPIGGMIGTAVGGMLGGGGNTRGN